MSLLDLNLANDVLDKLNQEMQWQLSEDSEVPMEYQPKFLTLRVDGETYIIYFLNGQLWNSAEERRMEQIPPEEEIRLNERENFEAFLRVLIQNALDRLSVINVLPEEEHDA